MGSLFKNYNVEPVGDFIIVKREEQSEQTAGGIYVPESSIGVQQKAKVLAVGPGRYSSEGLRIPPQVAEGDTVILDTIAGMTFEVEGEKITVVREAEIVAIVRKL